ncbi:MAG: DUF4252 domain-containing protein [Saprospiraceae bacterium]|nr:DUF4252 domain-containing protein [Saprospiraceae bacterium]
MKHLFLLALLCLTVTLTTGQNVIEKHYQNYVEQEDITEVYVSGQLFQYAAHFVDDEDFDEVEELGVEDAKDFILSIESFQLIKVPELTDAASIYEAGVDKISRTHDELIAIRDNDSRFTLLVDEYEGIVSELVGIGTSDGEFIVFSLLGDMDFNDLGKIVAKIQKENMTKNEVFERVDIDYSEMKVYPNPASTDGILNIDVPQGMVGGTARIYDLNGSVISQFKISDRQQQFQAENLTPGYYVVELQNETTTMKKKVLVAK